MLIYRCYLVHLLFHTVNISSFWFGVGPLQCGESGAATEEPQTIVTPNYPDNYPSNTNCSWTIHAPMGHSVLFTFTDFKLASGDYIDIGITLRKSM